jgi:hypothetical protein
MAADEKLREQLLELLRGGHAHMSFDQVVRDFPLDRINTRPPNTPYTPWRLLEHMRIAQWDIVEFIRDPDYESPEWPEGYWPDDEREANEEQWQDTLEAFRSDRRALEKMVTDPQVDLQADLAHAEGYNVLREVLVVADHSAYHIGELAMMRQVMDIW